MGSESVTSPRHWLHLLAALLTALLLVAAQASAGSLAQAQADAAYAPTEGLIHPAKQFDHASKRQVASLEEFLEIDDDAEQYFKPPPILVRPVVGATLVAKPLPTWHRSALPSHRACAA